MTTTEIARTTGVPESRVREIEARVLTKVASRVRRMHAFQPIPFETHRCIQCDGLEEDGQHFTLADVAEQAIANAEVDQ